MVELDPHVSHPLGEKMDSIVQYGSGDYWDNQEYYNTQYKIITSDRVLVAAARDLGLQNDWEFLGYKGPPARAVSGMNFGSARPVPRSIHVPRPLLVELISEINLAELTTTSERKFRLRSSL